MAENTSLLGSTLPSPPRGGEGLEEGDYNSKLEIIFTNTKTSTQLPQRKADFKKWALDSLSEMFSDLWFKILCRSEQVNGYSAYIDATTVYNYRKERTKNLR